MNSTNYHKLDELTQLKKNLKAVDNNINVMTGSCLLEKDLGSWWCLVVFGL